MTPEFAHATRVDLAFALGAGTLVEDYRAALLAALRPALPWFESEGGAGIVGVRMTPTGGATGLLSRRARLTLRVPVARADETVALQGRTLEVAGTALTLGAVRLRPLQAAPTLYADVVHFPHPAGNAPAAACADESRFALSLATALERSAASACRFILGRQRAIRTAHGALPGFAVALHGCSAALSIRLQEEGVGDARALGCGVFVPHRKINLD